MAVQTPCQTFDGPAEALGEGVLLLHPCKMVKIGYDFIADFVSFKLGGSIMSQGYGEEVKLVPVHWTFLMIFTAWIYCWRPDPKGPRVRLESFECLLWLIISCQRRMVNMLLSPPRRIDHKLSIRAQRRD